MITDTLLCILLSLNVITSPGTYDTSQIDSFKHVFSLPISNVENNLPLLIMVLAEYEPEVPEIYIPDDVAN